MALFQRRPEVGDRISFTTYGMNRTLLIVGLGNAGKEYDTTRHNTGFYCLDTFREKAHFDPWIEKKDLKCQLTSQTIGGTKVILCKPQTFMNLSGEAVQVVAHFYKIQASDVIVVHDEVDVTFGQVRARIGGGSAGHNGIKSVTKCLSTEDYGRLRVGVGPIEPAQMDVADFVLQKFSAEQQAELPRMGREVTAWLSEIAYGAHLTPETRSFL